MGQHVWLLLATIVTELLVIRKWSQGQFPEPFPSAVKWGWTIGAVLLVIYPAIQVSSLYRSSHRPQHKLISRSSLPFCTVWDTQCEEIYPEAPEERKEGAIATVYLSQH